MKYQYISLFSGAGGLDLGLEKAGFQAISLCELENRFCDTLRDNQAATYDGHTPFKGAEIINDDIRNLKGSDLAHGQSIDLVVGGPPCQAFSSSGRQLSVLDSRGLLIHEFLRVVREVQPKMFLFENVRGLVTARDRGGEAGGVIRQLLESFWDAGYSCRAGLVNAADYGSFQRRVRCFILGARNGVAPSFPEPTHQKEPSLFCAPWRSLQEFLETYADPNPENYTLPSVDLADQLSQLPNGTGLKSPGRQEPTRPGGHWGYRQGTFIADLSLPARTVTASVSQDWVRWNGILRRLTLQEVKVLQGFPIDWKLCGSKAQQFKQVGNAVPSLLGELLGKVIVDYLKEFPSCPPQFIAMPDMFESSIAYTKKDHAKNARSRVAFRQFGV